MKTIEFKKTAYGCKYQIAFRSERYDNSGVVNLTFKEIVKLIFGAKLIITHTNR